jgi:hypothetical protein
MLTADPFAAVFDASTRDHIQGANERTRADRVEASRIAAPLARVIVFRWGLDIYVTARAEVACPHQAEVSWLLSDESIFVRT